MVTVTSLSIGVVCCALTGNQNSDYGFKSITFAGLVLSKYISTLWSKTCIRKQDIPHESKVKAKIPSFLNYDIVLS